MWEANQSDKLMGIMGLAEILRKQNEEDTGENCASVRKEKNGSYPEQ